MRTRILAVLAVLFLLSAPVWAVLGESVRSVQADQQRLRGQVIALARQGYSVHQIKAADGNVVREYVSQEGMVFGVSWKGATIPVCTNCSGPISRNFSRRFNRRTAVADRWQCELRTWSLSPAGICGAFTDEPTFLVSCLLTSHRRSFNELM